MVDEVKVKPMKRIEIRERAKIFRTKLGIDDALYIDAARIFETLACGGYFNYLVEEKKNMPDRYADTVPNDKFIRIREDVYDKAVAGDPHARSTLFHELFHLLHKDKKVVLCRRAGAANKKAYEDPEWQANCFAGELLVPKHLVKGMSVEEVMEKCKVSRRMAEYQLDVYAKEDNRGGDVNVMIANKGEMQVV